MLVFSHWKQLSGNDRVYWYFWGPRKWTINASLLKRTTVSL